MADDPRVFLIDPQEDLATLLGLNWVVGASEGSGGGGPENASLLYLLQDGRVVASRTPVMSARLIAYAQPV